MCIHVYMDNNVSFDMWNMKTYMQSHANMHVGVHKYTYPGLYMHQLKLAHVLIMEDVLVYVFDMCMCLRE